MITLNDYLYQGDTVFKILHRYMEDLEKNAMETQNEIDLVHANFLAMISELLEHNEFLTLQSNRIKEFYKYMAEEYPYLAFTFKGRIKSIIRAEEKFNGYVGEYIYEYYKKHGSYPKISEIKEKLSCFRDLIAYRIVLSLPKCHLQEGQNLQEEEKRLLYEIASRLPDFLREKDFTLVKCEEKNLALDSPLDEKQSIYYRDYVAHPTPFGYRSLHITVYDNIARCYIELQIRTKEMDDYAEIGPANHLGYEKRQELARARRKEIPAGACKYYDEAYERVMKLQQLDLTKIDVNMFAAASNSLINDGCGLYRGRLILPFEHLSRFQNNRID